MNRLYARRHWIYGLLATLLVLDAGVYFGWIRSSAMLGGIEPGQVAQLEELVAKQAAEVARLRRVRSQAPQLAPQLERFVTERFLPVRTGFSQVAEELEEAASPAGVRLGRVSYETEREREDPALERIAITSSVEGRYANLLRYLEELERSPHFYLIDELSVVGTQSGEVRLEMRLATYFRRGNT